MRGDDRGAQRRLRRRGALSRHRRRLAAQRRGLDRDTNGPLAGHPYCLRLTVDAKPDAGTTYTIADSGPTVDQREIVDTSFLELVRSASSAPTIRGSARRCRWSTASWASARRRASSGTASTRTATARRPPANTGRLWPIFAGERGEYELAAGELAGEAAAAGRAARARLGAIAATAKRGSHAPRAGMGRASADRPAGLPAR